MRRERDGLLERWVVGEAKESADGGVWEVGKDMVCGRQRCAAE